MPNAVLHVDFSASSRGDGLRRFKRVRVIDVERECLVTVVDSCRYITLSYVWGIQQTFALRKASREAFERPGGLSPRNPLLPRTLRDAILLTKSLNEQYLLIDSVCIIQDDEEDVKSQIDRMNWIYQSSTLTLSDATAKTQMPGSPAYPVNLASPDRWLAISKA